MWGIFQALSISDEDNECLKRWITQQAAFSLGGIKLPMPKSCAFPCLWSIFHHNPFLGLEDGGMVWGERSVKYHSRSLPSRHGIYVVTLIKFQDDGKPQRLL